MQIKRAFISAFKNRVFLPNFQKGNKKKKEITPSSFFTTRKNRNVFLQNSDLLHKQKMRLKP